MFCAMYCNVYIDSKVIHLVFYESVQYDRLNLETCEKKLNDTKV